MKKIILLIILFLTCSCSLFSKDNEIFYLNKEKTLSINISNNWHIKKVKDTYHLYQNNKNQYAKIILDGNYNINKENLTYNNLTLNNNKLVLIGYYDNARSWHHILLTDKVIVINNNLTQQEANDILQIIKTFNN